MSQGNANTNHHKLIIIGSGPAGYTAAIAARQSLPLMFSGKRGDQLMMINDENYGYPEGIMGPEMMEDFRKQAEQIRYPDQV